MTSLGYVVALLAGWALLAWLTDWPDASILLVDALFCWCCASAFQHRLRYLLLLHPVLVLVVGSFFQAPFLELGDGPVYYSGVQAVIPWYSEFTGEQSLEAMLLAFRFKDLSLGVFPIFLVPDMLYGTPTDRLYFLWQSCFHVVLVALCTVLAKKWQIMRDEYLLATVLFAVLSPSFFELASTPTRHIVTFASVFLFYISFMALQAGFGVWKLFWLGIAILLVLISKPPYLIPLVLYWCYFLAFELKASRSRVSKRVQWLALAGVLFVVLPFAWQKLSDYEDQAQATASAFGFLATTPLVSIPGKYLYALLSPFPWHTAEYFIETLYGGNPLLFLLHVLSSLTGLYFFMRLLAKGGRLFRTHPDLRPLVAYGLIMSLSIVRGASGYHAYLLIFFPFFAPMLAIGRHRLPWLVPVGLAAGLEVAYVLADALRSLPGS